MLEVTAGTHVLNCLEIAALVVHAGQPVARELLRDVRNAVAAPFLLFGSGILRALPDTLENASRTVGDASVQLAIRSFVVRAARDVRRVLRDAGHLERLA